MIITPVAWALIGFLCGLLGHQGLLKFRGWRRGRHLTIAAQNLSKKMVKWDKEKLCDER